LQIDASSRLSTACRLAPGTKWPWMRRSPMLLTAPWLLRRWSS
jgi:hypothetical protein